MNERIEEQPYDDRHNTPPRPMPDWPSPPTHVDAGDHQEPGPSIEMPERGKAQPYYLGGYVPMTTVSTGLVWRFSPGQELQDLGRITPDTIEALSTLDLRVVMAHLDSAAETVKAELQRRYSR